MAAARAVVSGPVEGGAKGWIFGSPDPAEVAARGYVMEEFFLEGEAQSYRAAPGTRLGDDGMWSLEPDVRAPFKTRFYVLRPRDPARFNGVVLVNWQNVTGNIDLGFPMGAEEYRGYAWVGVTAQKIGVDGVPGLTQGLTAWDPARYGTLDHPGDAFSYDIFSQAARAVGKDREAAASPDPLGGLKPELMIAMGGSQSSMRLGSYLNVAHQRDRAFDGFLLYVHWGLCPPLPDVSLMEQFKPLGRGRWFATSRINDTSGTPVLVLASESEALYNFPVRQPDTDTFRFWEMAGAAHASPDLGDRIAGICERDGVVRPIGEVPMRNLVEWTYLRDATIRRLIEWVRDGKAPARLPPIEIEAGEKPSLRRDRFGNALGGVRLPELEAPTARHRGHNELDPRASLSGESRPFEPGMLEELYPSVEVHRQAWNRAVDVLREQGLVLPEDEGRLRSRAAAAFSGAGAR